VTELVAEHRLDPRHTVRAPPRSNAGAALERRRFKGRVSCFISYSLGYHTVGLKVAWVWALFSYRVFNFLFVLSIITRSPPSSYIQILARCHYGCWVNPRPSLKAISQVVVSGCCDYVHGHTKDSSPTKCPIFPRSLSRDTAGARMRSAALCLPFRESLGPPPPGVSRLPRSRGVDGILTGLLLNKKKAK